MKCTFMHKCPLYLMLKLNRYKMDMFGNRSKSDNFVDFPEVIDLSRFLEENRFDRKRWFGEEEDDGDEGDQDVENAAEKGKDKNRERTKGEKGKNAKKESDNSMDIVKLEDEDEGNDAGNDAPNADNSDDDLSRKRSSQKRGRAEMEQPCPSTGKKVVERDGETPLSGMAKKRQMNSDRSKTDVVGQDKECGLTQEGEKDKDGLLTQEGGENDKDGNTKDGNKKDGSSASNKKDGSNNDGNSPKKKKPLTPSPKKKSRRHAEYKLTGILLHHGGSALRGHYSAVMRSPNDDWFDFNDEAVTRMMYPADTAPPALPDSESSESSDDSDYSDSDGASDDDGNAIVVKDDGNQNGILNFKIRLLLSETIQNLNGLQND
jgi:hypothetical protein